MSGQPTPWTLAWTLAHLTLPGLRWQEEGRPAVTATSAVTLGGGVWTWARPAPRLVTLAGGRNWGVLPWADVLALRDLAAVPGARYALSRPAAHGLPAVSMLVHFRWDVDCVSATPLIERAAQRPEDLCHSVTLALLEAPHAG